MAEAAGGNKKIRMVSTDGAVWHCSSSIFAIRKFQFNLPSLLGRARTYYVCYKMGQAAIPDFIERAVDPRCAGLHRCNGNFLICKAHAAVVDKNLFFENQI